jgi:hypothetical protein
MVRAALLAVVFAAALGAARAGPAGFPPAYERWLAEFRPDSPPAEVLHRFPLWARAHDLVKLVNARHAAGAPGYTYRARLTANADRTRAERLAARGLPGLLDPPLPPLAPGGAPTAGPLPNHTIDWRTRGVVGPVRNQGACGSCWAFSAVEQLASFRAQRTGKFVELSVSEVVDCDAQCYACSGCWPNWALEWVKRRGSLAAARDWPYDDAGGMSPGCQRPANDTRPEVPVRIASVVNVTAGDAAAVHAALYRGPVSAALVASSECFEYYHAGVFTCAGCDCGGQSDHAIQLAGIGRAAAPNRTWFYWLRNSWGTTWGEQGYMRFSAELGDLANIHDNVVTLK